MNRNVLLAASLFSLLAAACTGSTSSDSSTSPSPDPSKPDTSNVPVAQSQVGRATPNVSATDADELQKGNVAFAADLYKTLATGNEYAGKNMFFSPHSISVAMAMTYAGANGETAKQIADTMHFTLPADRLHPAMNALDAALASRGAGAKGQDGQPFRLNIANSLWGAPEDTFEQTFLDTLASNYGAGVRLTDFVKDPEGSRGLINAWVEKATEDKIVDLLPSGSVDPSTRMVLVNAVYFNAGWQTPFIKESTQKATFHGAGSDASIDMMEQTGTMPYAKGDGWQAVAMPYQGGLELVAVLPDQLGAFEQGFDGDEANAIAKGLDQGYQLVDLKMPKLEIHGSTVSLAKALEARGMTLPFKDEADFGGMTKTEPLHIADVLHQAFVSIDEDGTEAAAATAVTMEAGSAYDPNPPKPIEVTLDKPFVFFVRDNATGAVVFLGRYAQP